MKAHKKAIYTFLHFFFKLYTMTSYILINDSFYGMEVFPLTFHSISTAAGYRPKQNSITEVLFHFCGMDTSI